MIVGLQTPSRQIAAMLLASLSFCGQASAQMSHWLTYGSDVPIDCPGSTEPVPLKLSGSPNDDFLITSLATCADDGDSYRVHLSYLRVEAVQWPGFLMRDEVTFDWVGLALYRPSDDGPQAIKWLYDEVLPINGMLSRNGEKQIYFGDLEFRIPKPDVEQATYFTFYITWDGWLTAFGAL